MEIMIGLEIDGPEYWTSTHIYVYIHYIALHDITLRYITYYVLYMYIVLWDIKLELVSHSVCVNCVEINTTHQHVTCGGRINGCFTVDRSTGVTYVLFVLMMLSERTR